MTSIDNVKDYMEELIPVQRCRYLDLCETEKLYEHIKENGVTKMEKREYIKENGVTKMEKCVHCLKEEIYRIVIRLLLKYGINIEEFFDILADRYPATFVKICKDNKKTARYF